MKLPLFRFGALGMLLLPILCHGQGVITTVAGRASASGNAGSSGTGDGGPATGANLLSSWGLGLDGSGNFYIADRVNNRIRKVDAAGIITTVAGNGTPGYSGDGGPAASAGLRAPQAVVFDSAGNMYIADTNNFRVRKVNPAGVITTVADSEAVAFPVMAARQPALESLLRASRWTTRETSISAITATTGCAKWTLRELSPR